jgi:DNA-binding transcriptional MocR family regulator
MTSMLEMNQDQLRTELNKQEERYQEVKAQKLSLDMTRGKPCRAQLDLGASLLSCLAPDDVFAEDGTDCRNYGVPFGIPEAKRLFANMIGTSENHVIIGNNSSLNIMYDTLLRALVFGELESDEPWITMKNRKWLCPVPGYDRHFLVTQTLGFELIPVPLLEDGPDMDVVEKLVSEDASIKGMWCMPLYSNPDGYIYSSRVCERLASMKTAAQDFRIYWDNAYVVHHLYEDQRGSVPDILSLCDKAGNPNRLYEFASTSKISYAGAGISCVAANPDNLAHIHKYITVQTIGPDKVNQLRHVRYIPDSDALETVMKRQADIIRPKFEMTNDILNKELGDYGIARWNKPLGGYFISLFVYPGTAKRVVALAKEAGVALTPAGATYPYSRDPKDENIRIAPTFPTVLDVEKAISVLCICVKLAAAEKRLEEV